VQAARAHSAPTAPASALESRIENLHPALWRANSLGASRAAVSTSGFAVLDAQLPGGGWPHRVLTELLLPHPGLGEMRLLAPALAAIVKGDAGGAAPGRDVMLFDPPASLCGWALAQLGVDASRLLVVYGRDGPRGAAQRHLLRPLMPGADLLWALEQALKSGHVGAVLAWLPTRLPADALRRLQLAAQAHDGPAFVLRAIDARIKPSAAPLRLALQCGGIDALSVRVLKRRGPPLAQPLQLALPPVLTLRLRERAQQRARARAVAVAAVAEPSGAF
jgi:protein ImuA